MKKMFLIVGILILLISAFLLTACFSKNDQQEETHNEENGKMESPVDEKYEGADTQQLEEDSSREQPDNDTQQNDEQGVGENNPDKEGKDEANTSDTTQSGEQSSSDTQPDDEYSDDGRFNSSVIVLPKDHF